MKPPRFTDSNKWTEPYASAAETAADGYLRRKFARMAKQEQERKTLVSEVTEIKQKRTA